jgi:hypothetical protein
VLADALLDLKFGKMNVPLTTLAIYIIRNGAHGSHQQVPRGSLVAFLRPQRFPAARGVRNLAEPLGADFEI